MRNDDAFRRARRTGRVLQEGHRGLVDVGLAPAIGPIGPDLVGRLPGQLRQTRFIGNHRLHLFEQIRGRQCQRHIGIGDHAANPNGSAIAARRIGRNGDGSGIQASEESGDVVEALVVDEQHTLAGGVAVA